MVIDKPLRIKKVNTVSLGTLPCRYLKLTFGSSKIGSSVHVNSLRIIGCECMDEESKVDEVLNSEVQLKILNI